MLNINIDYVDRVAVWHCGMFHAFPVFPVAHLLNCLFVIKITISTLQY